MAPSSDHEQRPSGSSGQRDDPNATAQWYRLTGLGFEFIAAILLLGGLGWFLDSRFGTRPWLMLGGGAVGFAVGLMMLIRAGMRSFRD